MQIFFSLGYKNSCAIAMNLDLLPPQLAAAVFADAGPFLCLLLSDDLIVNDLGGPPHGAENRHAFNVNRTY